jgi:hypothetical protein
MQIFTLPDGTIVGSFDSIESLPDGNYMAGGGIIPADQVTGGVISDVPDDYINPAQQSIIDAELKANCKAQASSLLSATDWTTIPDITNTANNPYLLNQAEFIAYRNTIRALAVNPVTHPTFPVKPTEQWSS